MKLSAPPISPAAAVLLTLAALAGCGTKAPLVLPPGPAKPPLLGGSAPAPAPTPPANPASARDDSAPAQAR